jgi:hypothetical protein
MYNLNKIRLKHIFQIFIAIATLISLYMLISHLSNKHYRRIPCWQFPMLLAILLESFII